MDSNLYITHPANAQQARDFTQQQQPVPASLSYPNGAGHLTPPSSEKDGSQSQQKPGVVNGQAGNGVVPNTPAATPSAGAGAGVSGIVPTLQ